MATTKEARYLFRVAEGASGLEKGTRQGTVVMMQRATHPFIAADCTSECPGFDPPLESGGFFFSLRPGTTMEEANGIADFLNQKLLTIGTVTGDAEDVAAEVEQSHLNLVHAKEGLTGAVAELESRVTAGDLQGATQSLEAVRGWACRLSNDWAEALNRFR